MTTLFLFRMNHRRKHHLVWFMPPFLKLILFFKFQSVFRDLLLLVSVSQPVPSKRWSIAKYIGQDKVYTLDAKVSGNIGRYLNHSCSPNVFVQNVYVDTHDLSLPWVAFFAAQRIKAGSELCWDYAYTVGSVPGKEIKCHCGSTNCRRRLL